MVMGKATWTSEERAFQAKEIANANLGGGA